MPIKNKLLAHGWLIVFNSIIAMVIALRYYQFLPELPSDALGLTFLVVATFSQMTLLVVIGGVISLPFLWLPEKISRLVISLVASAGIGSLVIDTFVFAQYRFHINKVVLDLVFSGEIVSFALVTWLSVGLSVIGLIIFEWWLLGWLRRTPAIMRRGLGLKFSGLTFITLLLTHGIHIWAAANVHQSVTMLKRYLPAFYPATSTGLMREMGWIDLEAVKRQKALIVSEVSDLSYPLKPLEVVPVTKPVNILFLVVDSWRANTFNADNTPAMWAYAKHGLHFNHHLSTGNGTRAGIFGLFYGVPSTYWHSFLANHRSPLFIDRLQQLNYQIGVFGSAQLHKPEFDQTVFVNVPHLRTQSDGDSPSARDADITKDWLSWFSLRDTTRPSFSFLFYDSPHGYDFPKGYPNRYEPMLETVNYLELTNDTDPTPFLNRYKTSIRYVDDLAKKVLDRLKSSGELDNTVIVMTGDHAQELNDNKLNYWGHTSNFTDAQIHVPFVILAPDANRFQSWPNAVMTSHQDVTPTLMAHYLGVTTDMHDYSTGIDLLGAPNKRNWVISSNYNGYALITNDSIIEVGTGGQYELRDKTNHLLPDKQPNFGYMQKMLEQISRFNK
jgi:uncharacterized protein